MSCKHRVRFLPVAVAAMAVSGCSLLNPYASDFSCPKGDPGKCQSIRRSYEDSFGRPEDGQAVEKVAKKGGETGKGCEKLKGGCPPTADTVETTYREQLLERFRELLEIPQPPVVAPAQTMRILILPYRGTDGELFMGRYIYVFTEGPRWVLEDIR